MTRSRVAVLGAAGAVFVGALVWTWSDAVGQVGGGGPTPAPGMPRAWEGGLPVTDYSVFNLSNGNLLTALTLTSWDPVGPPVDFTIYHNSGAARDGESGAAGQGFDLGDGWSVSYSGRIDDSDPNNVIVIEDDGSEDVYTLASGVYQPPAGMHDRLEEFDDPNDPNEHFWRLTRPSQWTRIFDDNGGDLDGLLLEEIDSSGNTVTVVRDEEEDYRIDYVDSAATVYNRLIFGYDPNGLLDEVSDPIGRDWVFNYDGSDRLSSIDYPSDGWVDPSDVAFTYYANDQIETVTSRDELTWTYKYRVADGVLKKVIDPGHDPNTPAGDPNDPNYVPPYEQEMTLLLELELGGGGVVGWTRTIIDRREYEWEYSFDAIGNLVEREDPLGKTREYTWDSDHNQLTYTDELNHTWTSTFGPVGNLLTQTSPLATTQTWTQTWEAVGDPNDPNTYHNFWQLTKVTDPAGKWVEYEYADPNEPNEPDDATLVTAVIEMADDPNDPNAVAVTTLEYYDTDNARGQLKKVTDANGSASEYAYDDHGYTETLEEGFAEAPGGATYPYKSDFLAYDGIGWVSAGGPPDKVIACWLVLDTDGNNRGGPGGCGNPDRLGNPPSPTMTTPGPDTGGPGRSYITYTPAGLLEAIDLTTDPNMYHTALSNDFERDRCYDLTYDEFNNLASVEITSKKPGGATTLSRFVEYPAYDAEGRLLQSSDTDDVQTFYTYTACGELHTLERDSMSATLTYDDAGRLTEIEYGNGATENRVYDEADRLTEIRHEDDSAQTLYKTTYAWTINNWVNYRIETDYTADPNGVATLVYFVYDNRGRLIREFRYGTAFEYDLNYEFDQLGNRLTREDDADGGLRIEYDYDVEVEDPDDLEYPTRNNRLLEYRVYGPDAQEQEQLLRTVRYVYYENGNTANIIVKDEYVDATTSPGDPNDYAWHNSLALYYDFQKNVRIALHDRWQTTDPNDIYSDPDPNTYEKLSAKEFRMDLVLGGPRARYIEVEYDDVPGNDPNAWTLADPLLYTDYEGFTPYQDLELTSNGSGGFDDLRVMRYFGNGGDQPLDPNGDPNDDRYYHPDVIGSTNLLTDENGDSSVSPAVAYTAFGEVLDPNGVPGGSVPSEFPRYDYAGGHGYESGMLELAGTNSELPSITLQHVGHRWYQPDIGRFGQRDPIGIFGGINVYTYAGENPILLVDPTGNTYLAGALPVAGGIAVADGPFPVGDAIAAGILICVGAYDVIVFAKEHTKGKRKSTAGKHFRGKRRLKQPSWDKKRKHPGWQGRGKNAPPMVFPGFGVYQPESPRGMPA